MFVVSTCTKHRGVRVRQVCATEVRVLQGARRLVQTLTMADLLPEDAEVQHSIAVALHPSNSVFATLASAHSCASYASACSAAHDRQHATVPTSEPSRARILISSRMSRLKAQPSSLLTCLTHTSCCFLTMTPPPCWLRTAHQVMCPSACHVQAGSIVRFQCFLQPPLRACRARSLHGWKGM